MFSCWTAAINAERLHTPGPAPQPPATLTEVLEASFQRWPRRTAVHYLGRSWTYAQLEAESRALAAWLQASGLQRGDRVALMLPNLPQLPVAAAAVLRAGMALVNIAPGCAPAELEHLLRDSGARAVVAIDEAVPALLQVWPRLQVKRVLIATPGDLLGPLRGRWVNRRRPWRQSAPLPQPLPGALGFAQALAAGRKLAFTHETVAADDIALLQYTGGTTARPLGAVLLHRNLVANLRQCEAWFQPAIGHLPPEEALQVACALPLHHIYGFSIALMLTLHLGGCALLLPAPDDAAGILRTLVRHPVHCLPGTDEMFQALAGHPECERVDWSPLRLAVGGSMPVRQATARLWLYKTGCVLSEGYGLTETSPAVSCTPVDGPGWNGSIGLPLPDTELRLLDEMGQPVPLGTAGEIAVRGPQVMAGYWQRPEETARVMTADGFFRTGDIGVQDEYGALRLVDRKKDTILVSGFNVYPSEVERIVTQMPGVAECAAVALPDARVGEAVKLVVVKADPGSASPSEAEVRAHCEAHLTGYKRPRVVEFRADLPRTTVGKVMRRALREHG
jgi:long-chain acyl-CoA synthetase